MTTMPSMTSESDRATATRWLVAAIIGLALADRAVAQAPGVSGGMSREEILRRFDLDANGRIDEGEAETARVRMRRDKMETLRNGGIDPLTGRPRGAAPAADERVPQTDDELLLVPGKPDGQAPTPPRNDEARKPAAKPPATVPAGRLPAMTGGVRAGAPAVRSGYGAPGPKQDLNAGRPRPPQPPAGASRTRAGLQPAGQPPVPSGQPRAPAPRPPLYPRNSTRPTAEDIGR